MKDVLIVVDMQNDFIDGSLGSEQARAIVPVVCELVRQHDKDGNLIVVTQDLHYEDYLSTLEGRMLPVKHCVLGTSGFDLCQDLVDIIKTVDSATVQRFSKNTFGSVNVAGELYRLYKDCQDEVTLHICGLCTDICVVSNALLLRAFLPNTRIVLHSKACAGTSEEAHNSAITTMKSNQIEVED